ncbi:ABC transporter permease [Spiroplasma endosymbiont of Atherix ibis]|uniref:ABC transporter permease n=1 Tax=Spiroplasma endosymbiont of Atherix ibis TaxID=3066291 RepID=UPI0030CB8331
MKSTNWNVFKIIFSMQVSNYKKDLFVIFSGWIVTILTLFIWLAFKNAGTGANDKGLRVDDFIVASAIGMSIIRNCLYNFVKTLFDFKSTLFFEKLFSTSISKTFIFFIIILFNQLVNILVAVFMFAISMIFVEQRVLLLNINWFIFLLGFFLMAISSNLLALVIVFVIKKVEWALVIANIFYFLPVFLLGLGVPWSLLENNKPIMILGFFLPQRYFLNIMASGWVGDIHMQKNQFGYGGNYWIAYIVSIAIIVILTLIIIYIFIKKFEYENKKFQKYQSMMKHMAIIYSIKKENSIEELNEIMKVKELTQEIKQQKKILRSKEKNAKKE